MRKFYFVLIFLSFVFSFLICESITVSGDVSGSWDVDTVIVEGDIELPEGEELSIAPGTNVLFGKYSKFDVYGSLSARGEQDNKIIFKNRIKESIASFMWFTDNNFYIRGLYPGELDESNCYYSYRNVFEGKVHSNSDIWLQERGSDTVDDGFENFAGSGYWPIFLGETTTAGNFTGNTTYPNDYDPDDILPEDLMNEIMVTDQAPSPYYDGWTAPWHSQTPKYELPETARELRSCCNVWLNQEGQYSVIRARLDGNLLFWQGGMTDTLSDNTVLFRNVYDPWNINKPNDRDTIRVITLGMIEEARNKYLVGPYAPDHYRNDDSHLSPMAYEYILWDPTEVLELPDSGGIFVDCELWIEGGYGGPGFDDNMITIGSSGNIRITGNIWPDEEALNPLIHFTSPDSRFRTEMNLEENLFLNNRAALGLVAEEKIIIGYTPANYGVYYSDIGVHQIDGGITIFAALAALGTDGNDDENTYDDGMFTFEMWHPPASAPVWGEPFSHMLGNPAGWVSYYPVDLDSDGDVDIMLDWNNPRDLQHLFYFDPHRNGNQGWLMHPDLIGNSPYANPGPIQAGHYLYQGWEWDDEWQQQYGFIIPNIKNRGTMHLCGALAQRVRGHLKRTPFEPSEGGSNGNGGSFEDYTAGDGFQNGYNRDFAYDIRFGCNISNYVELPYYPGLINLPQWEGIKFSGQSGETSSVMENCIVSGATTTSQDVHGVISAEHSPNLTLASLEIKDCLFGSFGNTFIHLYDSDVKISNTTIKSDYAFTGTSETPAMRMLSIINSSPIISGCTFVNGSHSYYYPEILCQYNSSPSIYNTILWNYNDSYAYVNLVHDESNPLISNCSIMNGLNSIYGDGSGQNYDSDNLYINNIIGDPMFVGEINLHLSEGSPCIDAGTADTTGLNLPPWDMDANHRIWDGDGDGTAIIDIGAYEYGSEPYIGISSGQTISKSNSVSVSNYPNPFNPVTTIRFTLPEKSPVSIEIYNIKGQLVRSLLSDEKEAGSHSIVWDGTDNQEHSVVSGVYFYRVKYGVDTVNMKMLLLK